VAERLQNAAAAFTILQRENAIMIMKATECDHNYESDKMRSQ
jgi:hypothetical protein